MGSVATESAPHIPPIDARRYFGLDALRGGLMLLGIVLHSAMYYMSDPPLPLPMDRNTSPAFDLLMLLIHSFRMQAFFVLAGFFASLLVARRGLSGALRDRLRRVFLPLLAGSLTLVPLAMLFAANMLLGVRFGIYSIVPDLELLDVAVSELAAKGLPVDQPSLGHLWFLEYLCLFYLLLPLCIAIVERLNVHRAVVDRTLASPALVLALGLGTALLLSPFRGGQVLIDNTLLVPHLPSLALYGSFFVLGYVFHHFRAFLPLLATRLALWTGLSLVLLPLAIYGFILDTQPAASAWTHLFAVLCNGLLTWALIFMCMGGTLRFFDHESPWTHYIAQSAYWVYLVHLPAVCLSAWLLLPYDLPAVLKFTINCVFAATVAFASFHYWAQGAWVSDFLYGRRFALDWPWRKT